jgi:hypothetical protein
MPRPLYVRGKSPQYPLDRRLDRLQSRSGRCGDENILDPTYLIRVFVIFPYVEISSFRHRIYLEMYIIFCFCYRWICSPVTFLNWPSWKKKTNVGSSQPLVIDVCTCFSVFCEDYRSYVVPIPIKRVLSPPWWEL